MKFVKSLICLGIFALCFGAPSKKVEASQLSFGSTGEQVIHTQTLLREMGYFNTQPTGYYGPITENAVKRFQQDLNIEPLGIIGPQTTKKLKEIELMARVVHGEARGESYEGQVAVAAVILNRLQSKEFPQTVSGVIFERNAFTAVNDGQYYYIPDSSAYQAARDALLGWDPSGGALYYYNPRLATDKWIFSRQVIKQIGNHKFAI
ncbi:cell wall hydrolase [Bacillus sp. FJAT-18017]|uniref:cell wall hydrolase n=1 Tax=Bacillus sp. FJAT-18017 TaxID=1705566 RepID=UPI0006AEC984|nr:cell wall hydrolase [Bacillus sp. FJAT-18017]ALC92805.1 cell wall hydrolase [Bacillus sp. FJAT-18017]